MARCRSFVKRGSEKKVWDVKRHLAVSSDRCVGLSHSLAKAISQFHVSFLLISLRLHPTHGQLLLRVDSRRRRHYQRSSTGNEQGVDQESQQTTCRWREGVQTRRVLVAMEQRVWQIRNEHFAHPVLRRTEQTLRWYRYSAIASVSRLIGSLRDQIT
jgi:serine phosphatase RsbU (regulator of sigma subunit)